MAGAKTQHKGKQDWVIGRITSNRKKFDKYNRLFKLLDGWDSLENGGSIDAYKLMFAIKATALNEIKMSDAWGKDWKSYFGKNLDDAWENEYYYLHIDAMSKLNGKQAAFLIKNLAVSLEATGPDCWGDMLLQVVVVILVTFASSGWGTPGAIAIFTAAVSIGSIVTRTTLPPAVQFVLAVINIANLYEEAGKEITKEVVISTLSSLNTLATELISEADMKSTKNKLKEIQDKSMKLKDEIDAEEFERQIRFTYEDEYSVATRSMEVDPYHNLMIELDNTSVYASYWDRNNATWHQEE